MLGLLEFQVRNVLYCWSKHFYFRNASWAFRWLAKYTYHSRLCAFPNNCIRRCLHMHTLKCHSILTVIKIFKYDASFCKITKNYNWVDFFKHMQMKKGKLNCKSLKNYQGHNPISTHLHNWFTSAMQISVKWNNLMTSRYSQMKHSLKTYF